MNKLKSIIIYLLGTLILDAKEPRLLAKGEDYSVSVYERNVVIKRNSDGVKMELEGLLWNESPMYQYQPPDFFDDESNMAIFLMDNYQYWIVDVDALFRGEEKQRVYQKLEGSVSRGITSYSDNVFWMIRGIYPNKVIKGGTSMEIKGLDEMSFSLFLSGKKAYTLESEQSHTTDFLIFRVLDYKDTTERYFRYVIK